MLGEAYSCQRQQIFQLSEIIFSETPAGFFPVQWKSVSTKSFIRASGNGFSGQWKPFPFVQSLSSQWKQSLKLVGPSFSRDTIFQLTKIDFLASGFIFFYFLRQQSTTTSGINFLFNFHLSRKQSNAACRSSLFFK